MTFADLQRGEAIFVDANTLIYHFTNHPNTVLRAPRWWSGSSSRRSTALRRRTVWLMSRTES